MTMYSSPRNIMPVEYDTEMQYTVQTLVTNIGAFAASVRYQTEAYDVDPAIGSTAMPGFAELAAIYSKYRPLAMAYKFDIANQEAFPVTIITGFSNSSIASGSVTIAYAGNPLMRTKIIGSAAGQGTCQMRSGYVTVSRINGTSTNLFDDLYTGSTTSATLATAGKSYCYCGVITNSALTALGVIVTAQVRLRLRLFKPNWLVG